MNTPPMRLMLVGDSHTGKTCLIFTFKFGEFIEHFPVVEFDHEFTIDTRPVVVRISESGGQEAYDRLRHLSYPGTDIILIGFDIVSPASLENVITIWHPEIRRYLPDVPIILVGLRSDLRHDVNCINDLKKYRSKPVSLEEGQKVADRIGAVKYVECSAKTLQNVKAPFYAACKAVYLPKKGKSKKEVKTKK